MNFSDIGKIISQYAPTVGMALSSPVGAVAAIGSVIAKALGSNNDPNDIYEAIKKDPNKAEEKIKNELANNIEFQKIILDTLKEKNTRDAQIDAHEEKMLDLYNQDMNSARINYHNTNNKVDNIIKIGILSSLILYLFYSTTVVSYFKDLASNVGAELTNLIFLVVGHLSGVLNSYYGTSKSNPFNDTVVRTNKYDENNSSIKKKIY